MLDELIIEANEQSFVIVLQHGSNDVTCKQSINTLPQPNETKPITDSSKISISVKSQREKGDGKEVGGLVQIMNVMAPNDYIRYDCII